jgi:hypothetical protein
MLEKIRARLPSTVMAGLMILGTACFTFRNLIYPTLFKDEAFYLGASRAIIGGDLLLTQQGFDKPFLQALLPAIGIALAGDHLIGFRLLGFLAYIAAALVWWRVLTRALGGSLRSEILACLMASALFLNPLLLPYAASAMAEPFLLLMLGTMALYWLKEADASNVEQSLAWDSTSPSTPEKGMALSLALGIATKQTALFWLPFLLVHRPRTEWKQRLLRFLKMTRWMWGLLLLYFLFNKKKFAVIGLAFHLMSQGSASASPPQSLWFWTVELQRTTFGLGSLFLLLIAFAAAQVLRQKGERGEGTALFRGAVIATAIHFVVLIVFRAPHYTRYLVIFLPQLALASALSIRLLSRLPSRRVKWLPGFFAFPLLFFLILPAVRPIEMLNPSRQLGRDLMMIRQEVPSQAILQVKGAWWEFLPYVPEGGRLLTCGEPECWSMQRRGRPLLKDHYAAHVVDESKVEIWRAPFVSASARSLNCWRVSTVRETVPFTRAEFDTAFLKAIRLGDQFELRDLQIQPQAASEEKPFAFSDFTGWRRLGSESLVTFRLISQDARLAGFSLDLRFRLVVHPVGGETENGRQNILSLRLEEAKLGDRELTDLLAAIWRGYTIDLGPIDYYESPSSRVESVEYSPESSELKLTVARAHALCN